MNGGTQLGIDFQQSLYLFLESPTLCMIFAIAYTYHLTIGNADVTNAFHNTLQDSS